MHHNKYYSSHWKIVDCHRLCKHLQRDTRLYTMRCAPHTSGVISLFAYGIATSRILTRQTLTMWSTGKWENFWFSFLIKPNTLAWIYMNLRNVSCLIIASGHHWENKMSRQKSEPLDNCICWLYSANQKAHHEHWIVFRAYKVGVALHCALHHAVSNDLCIVCNAFWTAFLFL